MGDNNKLVKTGQRVQLSQGKVKVLSEGSFKSNNPVLVVKKGCISIPHPPLKK